MMPSSSPPWRVCPRLQVVAGTAVGGGTALLWTHLGAALLRCEARGAVAPGVPVALAWGSYAALSAVFLKSRVVGKWAGNGRDSQS